MQQAQPVNIQQKGRVISWWKFLVADRVEFEDLLRVHYLIFLYYTISEGLLVVSGKSD